METLGLKFFQNRLKRQLLWMTQFSCSCLGWGLFHVTYPAPSTGLSINMCWRCAQSSQITGSACISNVTQRQPKWSSCKDVKTNMESRVKNPEISSPLIFAPLPPVQMGTLELSSCQLLPALPLHSSSDFCPRFGICCAVLQAQSR